MFKHSDRVKMFYQGKWEEGDVTVCKEHETKVMFDNSDMDYWYYPNSDLVLVDKDELSERQRPKQCSG